MSETTSSTTKRAFVGHRHPEGIVGWIGSVLHLPGFDHEHGETDNLVVDRAMRDNNIGIITVWLALGLLWLTTVIQAILYTYSNSVALLADTAHNLVDALNSIPLLIAFYLARRVATRRFTYGFGRAEDIAGIFIVLSIVYSAIHIMVESFNRFINPRPLENLGLVVLGAVLGFVGNEAVAMLQIRTGKRIGSEAMIADGQHARIDGVTSLAVLVAVIGTALNVPILDPIVGMVIGVAIIGIAIQATRKMFLRLMDGVDPSIMNRVEHFAETAPGVESVESLRVRWIGHRLFAEIVATVDETRTLVEGYSVAQNIRKSLYDAIPAMGEVVVSIKPAYTASARKEPIPAVAPGLASLLPPRYQTLVPSSAPMGAAGLKFDTEGAVAWDEIWTDFCDLALAGGPPHRGTLLEPGDPVRIEADPEAYEKVLAEIERGIHMVTGLETVRSKPGWVGMICDSEEMALWLLRAIVVENVSVRREDKVLFFPAGADFRLEKEIKNVVTVIAKTTHYWQEHVDAAKKL